jgi:brefeldin A-resistance guanine nucleotide exchange factor 1
MLNTDLHNPVIKEHMTIDGYKKNLRGVYKGEDFPGWYLEKIFASINDKEIVMPEEHHDSSQYFEDLWNNLISTNLVLPKSSSEELSNFEENDLLQFNKYIFQSTFEKLSSTIFSIFDSASDDQIITKMMTTIDHLAQIAAFFKLDTLVDSLVSNLAAQTRLDGTKKLDFSYSNRTTPLRLTRIKVEGGETINISSVADAFGSDFKAQLSTVVLFRVLKRNASVLQSSWANIITILFTLLQNGLLDPNITFGFQERHQLEPLPGIIPEVILNRSAATKGLLSTFASYLKGEDEPTDEEVEATLSALDCIKSANIHNVFEDLDLLNKQALIKSLWEFLPEGSTPENKVYYETQLLMIVELVLALVSTSTESHGWEPRLIEVINSQLSDDKNDKNLKLKLRLITYKLLVINSVDEIDEPVILKTLEELVDVEKELFESSSAQLIEPLSDLGNASHFKQTVLNSENYWKILRIIASIPSYTHQIFKLTERIAKSSLNTEMNSTNFMWLLGLLDEISAVGAIGGQWEQEYDSLIKAGKKVTDREDPHQEIVQLSLQNIKFTSSLIELKKQSSKEEMYALIQALAHQCLNPCFQIRSYSLSSLEEILLSIETSDNDEDDHVTRKGIFELGLFPLLNEDVDALEILRLISKVYLHYYQANEGVIDEEIFVKILEVFNQRLEDGNIEEEMQKLIVSKKEFQKSQHGDDDALLTKESEESNVIEEPVKGEETDGNFQEESTSSEAGKADT